MTTGSKFDFSRWDAEHKKHIAKYLEEIDALYHAVAIKLIDIGSSITPEEDKVFSFSRDKKAGKEADAVLSKFKTDLASLVAAGIASEWNFANKMNDSWVKQLFPKTRDGYLMQNLGALEALQRRKMYGHTLSGRVWNYTRQFKREIELALDVGIGSGKSAADISRDVRKYLNEPERLFRRVRDKYGNLTLSKAARAYHPGQGVYRSSFKNAQRLTRTAVNMAYNESNYTRWQQFDFVVGIKVQVSKSHASWLARDWYPKFKKGTAPLEICDAMQGVYPKDFKFIGWHPNCRCIATPILADVPIGRENEATNRVTNTPKGFNEWVSQHSEKMLEAAKRGKLPYFVLENKNFFSMIKNM